MGRWVCFCPKRSLAVAKIRRETPTFATEFCGENARTLSGKSGVSQKSGCVRRTILVEGQHRPTVAFGRTRRAVSPQILEQYGAHGWLNSQAARQSQTQHTQATFPNRQRHCKAIVRYPFACQRAGQKSLRGTERASCCIHSHNHVAKWPQQTRQLHSQHFER